MLQCTGFALLIRRGSELIGKIIKKVRDVVAQPFFIDSRGALDGMFSPRRLNPFAHDRLLLMAQTCPEFQKGSVRGHR